MNTDNATIPPVFTSPTPRADRVVTDGLAVGLLKEVVNGLATATIALFASFLVAVVWSVTHPSHGDPYAVCQADGVTSGQLAYFATVAVLAVCLAFTPIAVFPAGTQFVVLRRSVRVLTSVILALFVAVVLVVASLAMGCGN